MITLGVDHAFDEPPDTLATELAEAFIDNVLPGLVQTLALVETRLRIATVTGEIVVTDTTGANGSDTSESLPPNVALPIRKLTAFGGRANAGRWFVPGLAEDLVDPGGAIGSTARDAFTTSVGQYMADLATADFTPVILHSDPELTPTVILAMLCGSKVFTRGSRLR